MKITNDIEFIIMACDGVWDCVDPQKLCEHISLRLKSNEKISAILAELFDQIISKTNNSKNMQFYYVVPVGTDNMTCILIQFQHI
jgi:serine/threonine protein phosphatase PrpC